MLTKKILSFIILSGALFCASGAHAGLIPPADAQGNYTLNDFVQLGINISNIILGVVGSLSLLMFIYGGLTFLISAGSPDQISKAKKIIIAAVVGLIIVFTSYLIIAFILQGLGYQDAWGIAPKIK